MVWVALDRAIYLAENHGLPGDVDRWRRTRETIRERVLTEGYDPPEMGSFVQAFGSKALDAANLRIPLVEFLPPFDDERVQGTIDATIEHLTKNGLVYRYLTDDGLPPAGRERSASAPSGWWTSWPSREGGGGEGDLYRDCRPDEQRGSPAGRIRSRDRRVPRELPPQAYTHIGLVNSALYLAHAEGRWVPPEHAPVGIPPREGGAVT